MIGAEGEKLGSQASTGGGAAAVYRHGCHAPIVGLTTVLEVISNGIYLGPSNLCRLSFPMRVILQQRDAVTILMIIMSISSVISKTK